MRLIAFPQWDKLTSLLRGMARQSAADYAQRNIVRIIPKNGVVYTNAYIKKDHLSSTHLEVPQFFGHENGNTPVNKGRNGEFHFALSENPAAGTRRRFRAGGENGVISVCRHPVFSPKNAKSDASSLFSASPGSNPRHLRPLFRMSLAPSAIA